MRTLTLLILFVVSCLYLQASTDCQDIGGPISTNFLNPTTTFGTAGGDLKGAVGVTVLNLKKNPDGSLILHNQHHWVTESGDIIQLAPADATAYPSPIAGLYAASYLKGLNVVGGTGRFAGASGKIQAWGAIDLGRNQISLRYEGTVCFKAAGH